MTLIPCPYLNAQVELTDERRQHILEKHPDLLPEHSAWIVGTVAEPDEVRRDQRFPNTRLFSRDYRDASSGKFVVVAVVSDKEPATRHWIVTAYLTRRIRQGATEWRRS